MAIDCRCDICKFTLSSGDETYCGGCYKMKEEEVNELQNELNEALERIKELEKE